ncbi:MAG TPA: hypothetical protein VJZ00_03900 [Thermoanaerobaculia bacterium]|nr:hypothetical protein [Thermoanaerobaculia bacterium]
MRRVLLPILLLCALSARAQLTENVPTRLDSTQTYTLFLPPHYDTAKKYPLLLVFDPRSRGTTSAEFFRPAAEEYGWIILSSNGTRSDEGSEGNQAALRALVPEVKRYAVDPERIYAAGFSGTAMLAWALGVQTGGLAGVIASGGRLIDELPPAKFPFASYGFSGDTDFNNRDMRAIDALLERAGKPHRFVQFKGEHRWMPPELVPDAFGWFELMAMKDKKRMRDDALIAKLYTRDLASAAHDVNALRAVARTYDGLRDVAEVRAEIARLEADPESRRAVEEQAKWDRFEEQFTKDVFGKIGAIYSELRQSELRPTPGDITRGFRIAELKRRATREGEEGLAARRLLESVYSQLASYLPRELMKRKEYPLAVITLAAATEIHPDRWSVWYNLGAAQARSGDTRHALDSLEKSISLGFKNLQHIESDEDYAAVRNSDRYRKLILALRSQ